MEISHGSYLAQDSLGPMMKTAATVLLGLLGTCSALIKNVHLLVNGPIEFEQLQSWLSRFPASHFYLYGEPDNVQVISDARRLGYHIQSAWLDSECPSGLCTLNKFGGLLASIDDDTEQFSGIPSSAGAVLWKERKKTEGPCPWCVNGVFEILETPIISPPGSLVIEEVVKLLKQNNDLNRALMLSVKKHPQRAKLLMKSKKIVMKTRTRMAEYTPYLKSSKSLDVSIISREKISFLRLSVSEGELTCGEMTGKTLEGRFDTQSEYNGWIQSCLVSSTAPKTRLRIDIGGYETLDVWLYRIEELVTIVVKTFGRMDKVRALVESVQGLYPNVPIVVGDDGKESELIKEGPLRGFYYCPFPYDIGLSEGRNRLVDRVKTEYVLFLDDDFVLTQASDLGRLAHELSMNKHDLVAGKSPNCDTDYSGTMRIHEDKLLLEPRRTPVEGSTCERVDIVPNLFMAETKLFQKIKWDPQLKLGEHEDFFLRAKRLGIRVATCPGLAFDHHQTPEHLQSKHYREMRARVWGFLMIFLKKHGLSELVAFGKSKVSLKPMAKIKSLAQVSAGPFHLTIRIETAEPHPEYKVDLRSQDGALLATNFLMNPEGLVSVEFPLTGLEPDRTFKVTVRPGNKGQYEDSGPTLTARTLSFIHNNLIVNPGFNGSTFGWKKSLGTSSIGLMPLFFSQSEPNFACKRDAGHFDEHIEGRPSEWAAGQRAKNGNRNYAAFLMAPPISSFSHIRPAFFMYQDIKINSSCLDAECQLLASAWARVDKLWGDSNLVFLVELLDKYGNAEEAYEYSLDPSKNQNWQLAYLDRQIMIPTTIERLRVALKVRCNVGAVFADDFFLSLTPI